LAQEDLVCTASLVVSKVSNETLCMRGMVKTATGQNGDKPKRLHVLSKRINLLSSTMNLLVNF